MKSHTYKTNINCNNCVAKITPVLNNESLINHWSVDTKHPEKLLTVEGNISFLQLNNLIEDAGFKIKHEEVSGNVSDHFWKDESIWKKAGYNTLNCLIGCTIGDFSMMIYLQTHYPDLNVFITMVLAVLSGLFTSVIFETVLLKMKEGFSWRKALNTAFMMSFISMVVMEMAENITDFILTGGEFHAHQPYYWLVLLISMIMGFIIPLPYNYYKLKKFGKSCH